jgi:uncharacterized protein with HEPN domain
MDNFADDKVKLLDILGSIEEIDALTAGGGIGFENFARQTHIRDGVVYHLREIGVGARLLSDEFKVTYGDVDWDVLTNLQYATWDQEMEIDPHALWYIVENDLSRIRDQILEITTVLEDKDEGTFFY